MSYRLDVAPDAWAELRQLDVEVQEAVLDEIDRIVEGEQLADGAHDLYYAIVAVSGVRQELYVQLIANSARNVLTVVGISRLTRP